MRREGPVKPLRGRRKEPFAATFFQFSLHVGPEFSTAVVDLWADSSDDALISHTVLQPASSLIAQAQQDRHASVDGFCETGFGSPPPTNSSTTVPTHRAPWRW